MSSVRLSICIPTYNFGRFIGDTIDSIRKQYVAGTEIVILDSGSTDETREVVARRQLDCPYLQYHFQPSKGGIDADLARTVALAQGEYCWLLSADDALINGALERMHRELDSAYDVYLCNRILCDVSLLPRKPQAWLSGEPADCEVSLSDDEALGRYFLKAVSIGALFSYMSTIAFKRQSWTRIEPDPEMAGTNYAHVLRLYSMRAFDARMKYLAAPLVLCRGDNDSFLRLGVAGRHLIDLHGFHRVAERAFPHASRLRAAFKRVVRREHRWDTWVWLRSVTHDESEWAGIRRELRNYGYGILGLSVLETLARMPRLTVRLILARDWVSGALLRVLNGLS